MFIASSGRQHFFIQRNYDCMNYSRIHVECGEWHARYVPESDGSIGFIRSEKPIVWREGYSKDPVVVTIKRLDLLIGLNIPDSDGSIS